jgi:hypothetical protein
VSTEELASKDIIAIGNPTDNTVLRSLLQSTGVEFGKNFFRWRGKTFAGTDDGLFAVFPNALNPSQVVYLVLGNSALEIYHMTKRYQPVPSWAVFKGDQIIERGYHPPEGFGVSF